MAEIALDHDAIIEGAFEQEVDLHAYHRWLVAQSVLVGAVIGFDRDVPADKNIRASFEDPAIVELLDRMQTMPFKDLERQKWIFEAAKAIDGVTTKLRRCLHLIAPAEQLVHDVGARTFINQPQPAQRIIRSLEKNFRHISSVQERVGQVISHLHFIATQALTQQMRAMHLPVSVVVSHFPSDSADSDINEFLAAARTKMVDPLTNKILEVARA